MGKSKSAKGSKKTKKSQDPERRLRGRTVPAANRIRQAAGVDAAHRGADRGDLRGPRRGGQGRHHQADHRYLSPRVARIAALPAPDRPRTRPVVLPALRRRTCPPKGEIVLFDRSWYNRAGVEKVMGFCTPQEHTLFLRQTPVFEQMLIEDGILLRKYWFSVSDDEQLRRFRSRLDDPVRQWKLSPMDLESIYRWEDYSRAKDEMMVHTDTPPARGSSSSPTSRSTPG